MGCGQAWWGIFLMICVGESSPDGLVLLGSVREQTEQDMTSKPVGGTPQWLLQQLLPPGFCPDTHIRDELLPRNVRLNNSSLPKLLLIMFYHNDRTPKRAGMGASSGWGQCCGWVHNGGRPPLSVAASTSLWNYHKCWGYLAWEPLTDTLSHEASLGLDCAYLKVAQDTKFMFVSGLHSSTFCSF